MIDNFNQIEKLLKFDSPNEFYFIQILIRKKDVPEIGSNSRVLKTYYIYSIEQLHKYKEEMIIMAKTFNARIMIHLNRRNAYNIALELMEDLAHNIRGNHLRTLDKSYSSVCGKHHSEKDKTWIVDIDGDDIRYKLKILRLIRTLEPYDTNKLIAEIPTKNGYHLITRPFNSQKFSEIYPEISLHKNNPSILYIP
jgi:hypothetical protein